MRITNLTAQILKLHRKIRPLEDEISYLKQTHAEEMAALQRRLTLAKKQLQDSERRLKDADTKNFDSIMEIAELRAQLKTAQRETSQVAQQKIEELEDQLQSQQGIHKKLENANRELQQEVNDLKKCCNDGNIHCEDLQKQLQQSQEDADRLQQLLNEKSASFKQLEKELNRQTKENERLQNNNRDLESQLRNAEDRVDSLQQQVTEKEASNKQLKRDFDKQTTKYNKLQDDYNNLQNEKNDLEDRVQALQNQLNDVEDKTIHTRRITLDPTTAHPRIVLSADKTEMHTIDDAQNVPDNPGRFDVSLAVLGKTGYSSGRHYWEVSVAGKNCFHLGMASESAQRKGSISFRPTNGFWTMVLNKQGVYKAIDRRSAVLSINPPLTLGILLDYKKGEVSFYDPGSRSHLYSFTSQTFTGKIYPFINFCVEDGSQAPITLLTPGSVDWIA
ncbi:E3 ubiquitin-protein ligase TRIM69 [Echeneis naucrates]|uniref:E3 ubiquitin-protein ligase TRIM69 n=1 Tax=Echeneis naucrates TaxID=173247 RepID=UPI001113DEFC|nr:E3 ubiquitin-protein ligase TRIM69-like [Echeneis naucrates]